MLEGGMGARPQAEHARFGHAKRAGVFPSITYSPLGRGEELRPYAESGWGGFS